MNEMIAEALRLWPRIGTLALMSEFSAIEQETAQGRPYLLLMADMNNVGRKGSMTVRVHRSIFPEHSDRLQNELEELYRDLEVAVRRSAMVGVKF